MLVSFKVQQRGVDATGDILSKLLEGLELQDSRPVLVVDCLPNRLLDFVGHDDQHRKAGKPKVIKHVERKDLPSSQCPQPA